MAEYYCMQVKSPASIGKNNVDVSRVINNGKKSYIGVILCAIASVTFALSTLCIKLSLPHFSFVSIMWFRALFQTHFALLLFYYMSKRDNIPFDVLGPKKFRIFVFFRGFFGTFAFGLFFFSISQLPLGDADAINFMTPIITAVIGYFWLGESWDILSSFAAFCSFIGVCLIARPETLFGSPNNDASVHSISSTTYSNKLDIRLSRVFATLLAIFGAFMTALAYTMIRKAGPSVHYMNHVISFGFIGFVLTASLLPFVHSYSVFFEMCQAAPFWSGWLFLLGMCFFSSMAQCFLNAGLQREKASIAGFMKAVEVVLSFVFQVGLLGEGANMVSILGAVIVILSTMSMLRAAGQAGSDMIKQKQEVEYVAIIGKQNDENMNNELPHLSESSLKDRQNPAFMESGTAAAWEIDDLTFSGENMAIVSTKESSSSEKSSGFILSSN